MMKRAFVLLLFSASSLAAPPDVSVLKNLQWREVGPYRGGRADAVEGVAGQPDVYYFASTGGGVWKTTDGGQTWKPVSDGFFGGSIGATCAVPSTNALSTRRGTVRARAPVRPRAPDSRVNSKG